MANDVKVRKEGSVYRVLWKDQETYWLIERRRGGYYGLFEGADIPVFGPRLYMSQVLAQIASTYHDNVRD